MLKGLLTLTRVLQVVLNAVAYFQAMVECELEELNGVTWVDGMVLWGTDFDILLSTAHFERYCGTVGSCGVECYSP